jgi:hypothetical protein
MDLGLGSNPNLHRAQKPIQSARETGANTFDRVLTLSTPRPDVATVIFPSGIEVAEATSDL